MHKVDFNRIINQSIMSEPNGFVKSIISESSAAGARDKQTRMTSHARMAGQPREIPRFWNIEDLGGLNNVKSLQKL